jgi:hypothetical protein
MTADTELARVTRKLFRTLSFSVNALLASTFGKYCYSTSDYAVGHDFAVYNWRGRTYCIQRSFPEVQP